MNNNFSKKNHSKFGEYYIGLDVGTGSVGWAVTDKKYNILKIAGKSLWGTRLFDTANTAAERRAFRTIRRNIFRRKQRISLLESLFENEIRKVDPDFLSRLSRSSLVKQGMEKDKRYNIFVDKNYTDLDFGRDFPTIYHLRAKLMTDGVSDIRLLFLGILHIIKHRGHFLFENFDVNNSAVCSSDLWENVCDSIIEYSLKDIACENDDLEDSSDEFSPANSIKSYLILKQNEIIKIIKGQSDVSSKTIINGINELIRQHLDGDNVKIVSNLIKSLLSLMFGNSVSLSDIEKVNDSDEERKEKLKFAEDDYETKFLDLSDELKGVVEQLKSFHDLVKLQGLLKGKNSISEAKIALYREHRKDIELLKRLIKSDVLLDLLPKLGVNDSPKEIYKKIFVDKKHSNDSLYSILVSNTYIRNSLKESKPKLNKEQKELYCKAYYSYDLLKKLLRTIKKDSIKTILKADDIEYLSRKLDNLSIFPSLASTENSVIPYQVNMYELNRILDVAKSNFSFLEVKDENGISIAEKIKSLLEFRIPYYVGPLNPHSKFAWIVKKSKQKITPWNFNSVVDLELSAERFIERMTSLCTYINGEKVLPKNSIIYSLFDSLNILNNVRVNGLRLEECKSGLVQDIIENLIKTNKIVTEHKLRKYLENIGILTEIDELSGIDNEQKLSMASFVEMKDIALRKIRLSLEEFKQLPNEFLEKTVYYSTVFTKNPELIHSRLSREFPEISNKFPELVHQFSKLSFSGWGKLSKKLLTGIAGSFVNDESNRNSIIGFMLQGKGNLMELLSDSYSFSSQISEFNKTNQKSISFSFEDLVAPLYLSPSVKRMVWQMLLVVREITDKIMGYAPSRIFIEMARGTTTDQKGKRSVERRKKIESLYKNCKMDVEVFKNSYSLEELKKYISAESSDRLLSDKLYLYYTQLGKCMYTGEKIDFEDLFNVNIYDIDHIFPQALTKDDSLDNRVLVKKVVNNNKKDIYPLSEDIRLKQQGFWHYLYKNSLISREKYTRLRRDSSLSVEEKKGFIKRQLVQTAQSTKAGAHLLEDLYAQYNTKVVYSKAGLVADFKNHYGLIKIRELNNLHHAKDAFCNIVVGNVYYEKFTKNFAKTNWDKEHYSFSNSDKSYLFDRLDERLKSADVWDAENGNSIAKVKKQYNRNDILLSKKQEEVSGPLFGQTIFPAKKGLIPKKKNLPIDLYGGYKGSTSAYFSLVKSRSGVSFEVIPLHVIAGVKRESLDNRILTYLCQEKKMKDVKILISKLMLPFVLKNVSTGFRVICTGVTGDRFITKQFNSLVIDCSLLPKLKAIIKFYNKKDAILDNSIRTGNSFDTRKLGFSREDISAIFSVMKQKVESTVFKGLPPVIHKALDSVNQNKDDLFVLETIYSDKEKNKLQHLGNDLKVKIAKCIVIYELLKAFQNNGEASDLRIIGESQNAGKKPLSLRVTDIDKYSIIYQSVTGFYEKEIFLKDLV